MTQMPAAALQPPANDHTANKSAATDQMAEPLYFARPSAQYQAMRAEIDAAIQTVLDGNTYILGDQVRAFEAEFAAYTGAAHGIGVANGTDAIVIALKALGIGPGDEVITTPHTAIATIAAVELTGATPVLADISADRYCLDPIAVAKAVTPRTKVILSVHLYGHPADLGALQAIAEEHNLALVEDCAQAHAALWRGRQVGTIGRIGCFSLYPTKNLGAIGDGGIVVTSDPALADRMRMLRQYGWRDRQLALIPGMNSRLDELQAAILRVKLRHLDDTTARRRDIAQRYRDGFADLPLVLPPKAEECEPSYHLFVIRLKDREALKAHLALQNIHAGIHYPVPAHRQPAYAERFAGLSLPVVERIVDEILTLPMYPELTDGQVDRVIHGVRSFFV